MTLSVSEFFRFAVIGSSATAVYLIFAVLLEWSLNLDAVYVSFIAYVMASVLSFLGHRYFTFRQHQEAKKQIVRFCMATVIGMSVAIALPIALHMLSPNIVYVLVAILVPVISFVLLKFFVFTGG